MGRPKPTWYSDSQKSGPLVLFSIHLTVKYDLVGGGIYWQKVPTILWKITKMRRISQVHSFIVECVLTNSPMFCFTEKEQGALTAAVCVCVCRAFLHCLTRRTHKRTKLTRPSQSALSG